MMMEKPRPTEEESAPPAFARAPETKKKSAEDAVKELEGRLAALGSAPSDAPEPALLPPAAAPPALQSTAAPQKAPPSNGKSALLARIKAAQEKAKNASAPPPPSADDVFGPTTQTQPPPPAFDTSLLPPPAAANTAPPPSFDAVEDSVMMQVQQQAPPAAAVMMPSAPAFEDLLGMDQSAPAPFQPVMAPAPPQSMEEEMIMGLEGLSEEERKAMLEEQRQIMAQIEKEKSLNQAAIAAAQADNFDMRSTSNAVSAIGGNTRIGISSANSAQANDPTLTAMEEEDRKLAEALQNEEYAAADGRAERTLPRQQPRTQQSAASSGESWWDTVSGMFSTKVEKKPATPQRDPSGQTSSRSPEQQINFSSSRDESSDLLGSRTAGGARVAKSQPLFTCVVDSVNSTVNTLTGQSLSQDSEGNVHGVDSSSLLAVPQVGRNTEYKPL